MKKMGVSLLVSMGMLLLTAVPSHETSDALIWTDKGCGTSYTVYDSITIYFTPEDKKKFELRVYDAVMNEKLLSEGVGDGQLHSVTVTAEPPLGPLTFVLKMPCVGCPLCDMCTYGQCSVQVEGLCQDHCTNETQDCQEYGIDCGGGCPFKDSDRDGVEDCRDVCPDSLCNKVDANGCEIDSDSDGVTDCEDECPTERGDASNKGCPPSSLYVILGGIVIGAVGGGLILWKMRGGRRHPIQ